MERSEMLGVAREASVRFAASLPKVVDARSFTLKSKIPFKIGVLRDGLFHRASALVDGSLAEFEAGRWIGASILVRAVYETGAVIYVLCREIESALASGKEEQLAEFLRRTMMGSRTERDFPTSINVLSQIDKVDKEFSGFKRAYDELSEFAHPNWCGVLGAFSNPNPKDYTVSFSQSERTVAVDANIAGLCGVLQVVECFYNKSADLLLQLNTFYESSSIV